MQKFLLLGVFSMFSRSAQAHPGHGESVLQEIFHTLMAADHMPAGFMIGMSLATVVLYVGVLSFAFHVSVRFIQLRA